MLKNKVVAKFHGKIGKHFAKLGGILLDNRRKRDDINYTPKAVMDGMMKSKCQ